MRSNNRSLVPILLMFCIDFIGIGLVFPMFSAMLFGADSNLLTPETPQAVRGLLLGVLAALMPFAQFFSGPILGGLSDHMGRKPLMLTSISFGACGYTVAALGVFFSSLWLLAISRIIVGIAAGNEAVGGAAISDISTPEEKTKNFGLLHMAAGFGFTIGPFLGGSLSQVHLSIIPGYAIPFIFAGLLCIVNVIAVIFLFKETHCSNKSFCQISFGLGNLKKAWNLPGFCLLFLALFFYNFGWTFYWEFLPPYLITFYKFNVTSLGSLCACGAAIYAISSGFLIRPWVSRYATEKVLFYALIFGGFSLAAPLMFVGSWVPWVCLPIQEYLMALIFPTTTALISNKSSDAIQGEMLGILQSVQSLALVLAPLTAGFLLGFTLKMPMIVGGGTFLLAACILWYAERL